MRLRAVTRDDVEALATVHASAFDAPWSGEEIYGFAQDRGAFAIAAEGDDGALAGFILCRLIAGEAEVLTLAVRAEARRQGVGAALVGEALGVAARSAGAMFLEVAADNPGAVELYEKAGFEPVGRRVGYYGRAAGGSVDALVMRRTLNS